MNLRFVTLYFLLIVVGGSELHAQQTPVQGLYTWNLFSINPAYTGYLGHYNLNFGHRRHFSGFNGPVTSSYFAGDFLLSENSGIGGYFMTEKANMLTSNKAYFNYSYKILFGKRKSNFLSMGASLGFFQTSINALGRPIYDLDDVVLSNTSAFGGYNDLGALLKLGRFQLAYSLPNNINMNKDNTNMYLERGRITYFQYEQPIGKKVMLRPSVMAYGFGQDEGNGELNLDMEILRTFMIGYGGRSNSGTMMRFGFVPNKNLRVGFTHERGNQFSGRASFSNEFMVTLMFQNKRLNKDEIKYHLLRDLVDPNPYKVIIADKDGTEYRYQFSTLDKMDHFVHHMDSADIQLYQKLRAEGHFELTLKKPEEEPRTYRFSTLERMEQALLNLNLEDKILTDSLIDQDKIILNVQLSDGSKKRYIFRTLKELDNFVLNLGDQDPELAAKLKEAEEFNFVLVGENGERLYKFKTLDKMGEIWLQGADERYVLVGEEKPQDDYILNIKTASGKTEQYKFKSLQAMNDFLLKIESGDPVLADKMKENGSVEFDVIMPDGKNKVYKFRTLQNMNQVLLSENAILNITDIERDTINDIPMIMERQRIEFQKLPSNKEILLSINEKDPLMAEKLRQALEDNPMLIVEKTPEGYQVKMSGDPESTKYNFVTLDAMSEFVLEMGRTSLLTEAERELGDSLDMVIDVTYVRTTDTTKLEKVKEVELGKLKKLSDEERKALAATIKFDLNSFDISAESEITIEAIEKVLKAHPKIKIQIIGRTCDLGEEEHNLVISGKRAKAVRDRLLKDQMSADQITILVMGEAYPLFPNTSEDNRKANRVVEFKLIED